MNDTTRSFSSQRSLIQGQDHQSPAPPNRDFRSLLRVAGQQRDIEDFLVRVRPTLSAVE